MNRFSHTRQQGFRKEGTFNMRVGEENRFIEIAGARVGEFLSDPTVTGSLEV